MDKISVIIATKNRKKYIVDLLSDIQNQAKKVDQVVVSDQSDVFEIIENKYVFELIHFQHLGKGPCCSRNNAVDKVTNEILVFLDDDARIDNNFIKEITNPILNKKYLVVSGHINHLNKKSSNKLNEDQHWFYKMTSEPKDNTSNVCYTPAGCTAITKKTFSDIGGFNEFFDPNGAAEDREFAVKIINKNIKIFYNPKAILHHIGAESGGRRDLEKSALEFKKNVGYIIYKYFSKQKFIGYRLYLIKKRLKNMMKLKMPIYNFQMLITEFKNTNPKKYN